MSKADFQARIKKIEIINKVLAAVLHNPSG